jgi:hypothetical protein
MQARGSCRDEYGIPPTDHAAQRALVIGPEVGGESALGLLGLVEPDEVQSRGAVRAQADLALVSRGGDFEDAGTHHLKGIDSPTRILRYRPAA